MRAFYKLSQTADLARIGIVLFVIGIMALHILPHPILMSSTHKMIPYDLRLNFMSEFVRTQYGWLMTLNFCILAGTAAIGARALHLAGFKRETAFLSLASFCMALLALFPTDLVDLRVDGSNCGDPTRIEPCTWIGRVHNPLSSIAFGVLGLIWLSFALRRRPEFGKIIKSGLLCFGLVVALLAASAFYLTQVHESGRHWVGLMQRSVTFPAMIWLWVLFGQLRTQTPDSNPFEEEISSLSSTPS